MNIGDWLLNNNKITQKQREKAELEHEVSGHKFGKCCLDLGFITKTDLTRALKAIQKHQKEGIGDMPTEIGENSKFTFDLKFLITMGTVIISACTTYFTITGQIEELSGKNSPSRLEFVHLEEDVTTIKNAANLEIITYKLGQYDESFKEIKDLVTKLTPLASDLDYIKAELEKLKNRKVEMPEVDLSGLEKKLDDLSKKIDSFETRLENVEKKSGGRF